jgi:hypothetical protein
VRPACGSPLRAQAHRRQLPRVTRSSEAQNTKPCLADHLMRRIGIRWMERAGTDIAIASPQFRLSGQGTRSGLFGTPAGARQSPDPHSRRHPPARCRRFASVKPITSNPTITQHARLPSRKRPSHCTVTHSHRPGEGFAAMPHILNVKQVQVHCELDITMWLTFDYR